MNVEVRIPDPLEALQLEVLEDQLNNARMRCLTSKTPKAQNRAYQEVQRLLAEYERRKAVPPPEPVQKPPNPPVQESKPPTFDVAGFWDFQKATTHRLKELLDMCQYEQTRSEPGSVTFDDAGRDITLIEAELRRRDDPELEAIMQYTKEELYEAVHDARLRYNSNSPGSRAGKEAGHEIDLLNDEFRKRGLTIPVLRQGDERKPRKEPGAA